jgi:hypothetical protein
MSLPVRVSGPVGQPWASGRKGIGVPVTATKTPRDARRPRRRRLYRKVTAASSGSVGFYGCADQRGRLVRCVFVGKGKAPESAKVDCPACGLHHLAVPMWRPATDVDKGRDAEVVIGRGPSERRRG